MLNALDRLLKETGRFSNSPVYVVGVYSGADKLGEGFGSSLKMAEFRVSTLPSIAVSSVAYLDSPHSGGGRCFAPTIPHTTATAPSPAAHIHVP